MTTQDARRPGATLSRFTAALNGIFTGTRDKHDAHRRARPVLEDMVAAPGIIAEILERHVAQPAGLNATNYPVVSCDIVHQPHFGLVANCWIPLPDRNTDLSTKAIHHHGEMLLTTITAFGPGYEHWTFTVPQARDQSRNLYSMALGERAPHPAGHVAFVDAYIPHVPFFPSDLTVTFALWSSRRATTWKDRLKRVPVLHQHSTKLRRIGASLGFARALDLKVVEYFDFSPTADGFLGMKDREEFPRGPNADYLHSLFRVIQGTESDRVVSAVGRQLETGRITDPELVRRLLHDLSSGRRIEGRLSPDHYTVPYANFTAQQVEDALRAAARLPVGV
jgi:hypothetical protein